MTARTKTRIALALALGAVAAAWFVVRDQRRTDLDLLEDVLARHVALGYGASLDDVLVAAPPLDPALQERIWEWVRPAPERTSCGWSSGDWEWYLRGGAEMPADVRAWHDAFRPEAEALRDLLASGKAVLTSRGWFAADRERLARGAWTDGPRVPGWSRALLASRWFALSALEEHGRGTALEPLDRLHDALARPGLPIEAMVAAAQEEWRDRTYLLLALRAELPPERWAAWPSEPPPAPEALADAFRGERLVLTVPLARRLIEEGTLPADLDRDVALLEDPARWLDRRVGGPLRWARDCATYLEDQAAFEGWIRGRVPASEVRAWDARMEQVERPFGGMRADHGRFVLGWLAHRVRHRAVRAAAALVRALPAGARPPSEAGAVRRLLGARTALLDAGPWDLALRAETVGEGRLRISVDPATPAPELVDPADLEPLRGFGGRERMRLVESPSGIELPWR